MGDGPYDPSQLFDTDEGDGCILFPGQNFAFCIFCSIIGLYYIFSIRRNREKALWGDENAANYVTLEMYDVIIAATVVIDIFRAMVFIFAPPGKEADWVEGNLYGSILKAFVVQGLRSFTSAGLLFYLTRNDAGVYAIRNAFGTAVIFAILTLPFMGVAYYRGEPFDDEYEAPTYAFIHDILHCLLYSYFLSYLYRNQLDRWRSGKRWIYMFTGCQFFVSLTYAFGDTLFYPAIGANGYCSWAIGDIILFTIIPILLCETLIDDSQYWRRLGRQLKGASIVNSTDVEPVRLLSTHILDPTTQVIDFSPIQCLDIELIDYTQLKINEVVGHGSNASVSYALLTEGESRVEVVVKAMHDCETGLNERQILSFCREAMVSTNFKHENVVKFYGVCVAPPFLYLVYEWCNFGNLAEVIHKRAHVMNEEMSIKFMLQAISGLSYIHDQGYVHRDVKTENFLLTMNGGALSVKLADFGSARLVTEEMNVFHGTFYYMAPEVLIHFPKDMQLKHMRRDYKASYGMEADIYSLTITLWEILTKKKPFPDCDFKAPSYFRSEVLSGLRPTLDLVDHIWKPFFIQNWNGRPSYRMQASEMAEFVRNSNRNVRRWSIHDQAQMQAIFIPTNRDRTFSALLNDRSDIIFTQRRGRQAVERTRREPEAIAMIGGIPDTGYGAAVIGSAEGIN